MSTVEHYGAVSVIRPDGPLRFSNLNELRDKVTEIVSSSIPYIVVDMTQTPLMDGAGLELFLDMDEECCDRGGALRLCNVGELCSDLLRATGIGENIQQFDDLPSAIASFA